MESVLELTQPTFHLQINIVHQTNYVVVTIYLLSVVTFTYDIYNYTPATNPVSVYNVAAIYWLQFMVRHAIYHDKRCCTFGLALSEDYYYYY
jgi:hypothetical protein